MLKKIQKNFELILKTFSFILIGLAISIPFLNFEIMKADGGACAIYILEMFLYLGVTVFYLVMVYLKKSFNKKTLIIPFAIYFGLMIIIHTIYFFHFDVTKSLFLSITLIITLGTYFLSFLNNELKFVLNILLGILGVFALGSFFTGNVIAFCDLVILLSFFYFINYYEEDLSFDEWFKKDQDDDILF